MRGLAHVFYVVMALWLLIGGARRIALELQTGADLDWSPFVGAGIALLALVLLIPVLDEYADRRRSRANR